MSDTSQPASDTSQPAPETAETAAEATPEVEAQSPQGTNPFSAQEESDQPDQPEQSDQPAKKYAGQYDTVEDLEKSHLELYKTLRNGKLEEFAQKEGYTKLDPRLSEVFKNEGISNLSQLTDQQYQQIQSILQTGKQAATQAMFGEANQGVGREVDWQSMQKWDGLSGKQRNALAEAWEAKDWDVVKVYVDRYEAATRETKPEPGRVGDLSGDGTPGTGAFDSVEDAAAAYRKLGLDAAPEAREAWRKKVRSSSAQVKQAFNIRT